MLLINPSVTSQSQQHPELPVGPGALFCRPPRFRSSLPQSSNLPRSRAACLCRRFSALPFLPLPGLLLPLVITWPGSYSSPRYALGNDRLWEAFLLREHLGLPRAPRAFSVAALKAGCQGCRRIFPDAIVKSAGRGLTLSRHSLNLCETKLVSELVPCCLTL